MHEYYYSIIMKCNSSQSLTKLYHKRSMSFWSASWRRRIQLSDIVVNGSFGLRQLADLSGW